MNPKDGGEANRSTRLSKAELRQIDRLAAAAEPGPYHLEQRAGALPDIVDWEGWDVTQERDTRAYFASLDPQRVRMLVAEVLKVRRREKFRKFPFVGGSRGS